MRSGLVIVGLVIAVVGAAVFVTLIVYPPTTQSTSLSYVTQYGVAPAPGGSGGSTPTFPAAAPTALLLTWSGNSSVNAAFYDAKGCPFFNASAGTCMGGSPIVTWSGTSGATYANSSVAIQCPCYLILNNTHTYPVTVRAILAEFYVSTVPALSDFAYGTVLIASVILLVGGGIAVFLGLFLRRGIYDDPAVFEDDPELADIEDELEPPRGPPT